MEVSDMNEILAMACESIESGFERVMVDPQDVVAIIDQHHKLMAALEFVSGCQNWEQSTGEAAQALYEAASTARAAINKVKGVV